MSSTILLKGVSEGPGHGTWQEYGLLSSGLEFHLRDGAMQIVGSSNNNPKIQSKDTGLAEAIMVLLKCISCPPIMTS